jgi:hypothetical protein
MNFISKQFKDIGLVTIYAILHPCFSISFSREENYHNTFNSDVLEAHVEEGIV